MHRFLFDLMKKFQLCFAFPDDELRYLIPELLDKQEAVETDAFPPSECLNFEYRYSVLPEGMLSRFIVRTHTLNVGLPRWRTGVVLAFEGNSALVKADVQDRRVFIRVSGPRAGRRRLLAVIRSDFDRIHADLKLRPEAFVSIPDRPEVSIRYQRLLTFESKGVETFPQDIGEDVVHVHVRELLDGVDLEGMRQTGARVRCSATVFVSYSHKDERFKDELETHLKLLQRVGLIAEWHDRKIEAGDDWKARIDEHLERADIVLLLVSADFIASDYCYEQEMMRALQRHAAGAARVIPVVVRDVNWRLAPFADLQALPKDGMAVNEAPSRDAAWRSVSEGIERVAQHIQNTDRLSA
jgi:internalin A